MPQPKSKLDRKLVQEYKKQILTRLKITGYYEFTEHLHTGQNIGNGDIQIIILSVPAHTIAKVYRPDRYGRGPLSHRIWAGPDRTVTAEVVAEEIVDWMTIPKESKSCPMG